MPPILLGGLLVLWLSVVSLALGRRLLIWLRFPKADETVWTLLAAGLGLGAIQFLPFALLAGGAASPVSIRLSAAILTLSLIPDAAASLRALVASLRRLRFQAWERVLGAIILTLLSLVFLRAVCPVTDDDGLSYHLSAAIRLLDAGRFVYLPTLTYTNWPLGVESLFILELGLHREAPVGTVQFVYAIWTIAAVWSLGRSIGGPSAGALSVTLLLVYRTFWTEATFAHVDLGTALFAVLAVYALWHGIRAEDRRGWLSAAALLAGFAATTKLLGIWVVVACGAILFLAPDPDRRRRAVRTAAFFALGMLPVAPWLARTWAVTGNPLYPLFYGVFGGVEWTPDGWPRLQHYFLLFNTPPGMKPTRSNLLMGRAALIAATLAVSVVAWRVTRRSALDVPGRFAPFFIAGVTLGSGLQLRLLMGAFPALCLCAGTGLSRLRIPPAITVALAALLAFQVGVRRMPPSLPSAVGVAFGSIDRQTYLRQTLDDYPIVEWANANLPRDAGILVGTWEERNAYYRAQALRPNYWMQDSVHYDSPQRLDADLARLGVRYLVLKPMDTSWCGKSSVCSGRDATETRALTELAARRGQKLYEANGIALYRLD